MNKATSITQSISNRLPNIPSFVGLDKNVLRRLEQNWSFTASKYPSNKEEHIRFFINLCKKEGFSGNESLVNEYPAEMQKDQRP